MFVRLDSEKDKDNDMANEMSWLYGFRYFLTESYFVKKSRFEIMIWDHILPIILLFF